MAYLTHEDVRLYILDRSVEDNDLDLDLAFADEEIDAAMRRAARAWNSIPPFISQVTWPYLPDDTNVFLEATAEQLYIALLSKLQRNDIDYTAGGVGTNLVSKRIEHLKWQIQDCRGRWQQVAHDIKLTHNLKQAFTEFY
jgi:hypothetical protein